jgi:hypothetical protein
MFEFTEDFLKLLQIALIVVGLLGVFLTFISYNITVVHSETEREAFVLGNAILSSSCITDGTKGLFIESKLNTVDPSCFKYYQGNIKINYEGLTKEFNLGGTAKGDTARFNALVKLGSGQIVNAEMVVTL